MTKKQIKKAKSKMIGKKLQKGLDQAVETFASAFNRFQSKVLPILKGKKVLIA